MHRPKALIFDIFGTIVDWRSGVATQCTEIFKQKNIPFDPHQFADLWRAQYQPAMQRIRSGNRGYVPLDILHSENLAIVLEQVKLANQFDMTERAALNHAWEKLPPWPDSVPGLNVLKQHFTIASCSNGSISLMRKLARFGDLPWHIIVGAEIAQTYKPAKQVYLKSCQALGLEPSQVMMVAAHNEDLVAARNCGLQTAFILRAREHGPRQSTDLGAEDNWDICANSITELAILLDDQHTTG